MIIPINIVEIRTKTPVTLRIFNKILSIEYENLLKISKYNFNKLRFFPLFMDFQKLIGR